MQRQPHPVQLSIVIPAYDEKDKIQRDIRNARRFLADALQGSGEIIVVDDGSADGTAGRARALTTLVPELRVISYTPRRGKGHALRTGFAHSLGEYVMFADAGSCVPYEYALRGLELCRRGADLAHGSRRAPSSSTLNARPTHRRLGSRLFQLLVMSLMGLPRHIRDTQCGFKIYRGDRARRIYSETFTNGFMFDIEVIRRAVKQGMTIAEFPVRWSNDPDTRYRAFRGTLANLMELLRIRVSV